MSDWIEWNGGKCPVKKGTLVEVKKRDGRVHSGKALSWADDLEQIFWDDDNAKGDIVAYRLHRPERPAVPITEQLRAAIAKRDKQAEKAQRHADKLDQCSAEVQRLTGELEREIEEATGLACSIGYKWKSALNSAPRHFNCKNYTLSPITPECVDANDPKTWKEGDFILCSDFNGCSWANKHLTEGVEYKFYEYDPSEGLPFLVVDNDGDKLWTSAKFRFVRRPS